MTSRSRNSRRSSRPSLGAGGSFLRRALSWAAILGLAPALSAQVVEEFIVASGPPRFGESPLVIGNLVAWSRDRGKDPKSEPSAIQLKDISRPDSGIVAQVPFSVSRSDRLLSRDYLFHGSRDGPPVLARRINDLLAGGNEALFVSNKSVVAVNSTYVFLKTVIYENDDFRGDRFFAKRLTDLGNDDPDLERPITEYREVPFVRNTTAASDRWFVWQDAEPTRPTAGTWKLYARRMEDLFTPGSERLVADTKVSGASSQSVPKLGIAVSLHGSLLAFEGAEGTRNEDPWGIYLLDLDKDEPPVPVALTTEKYRYMSYPSVSGDYVVWAEGDFFGYTAYARRIEDGKLAGEAFLVAERADWLALDRNIVVFNGATAIGEGNVVHSAIVAVELALPGASDVGDANLDGRLNLTDAVVVLNHLFLGGWRPRLRLADADESGKLDLSDAITILQYLFRGG